MIRRISKQNDLKDLIKSCPSGVIDDITEIRYFISGHPETEIIATFEKVGTHLEAILPTSDLATLSNGVLMRRALYKVTDSSYPDGYYNLEFIDNLDVWLGDEETQDPFDPGYLTEEDLKTLNGESLVGVGNIDVVNYIPDYYATKSWVSNQGYLTSHQDLSSYATQSWVSSNFLSSTALTGYATQSWVQSQGYLTSHQNLSSYATKSWVHSQGYITSAGLSGLATQSWVSSNFLSSTALTGYATQSWVSSQQFATQSWVQSQGYLTSHQNLSSYATQSWVSSNFLSSTALTGYATESWVSSQQFATQSWILSQSYITSDTLPADIATQSWVSSNFLSSTALTGYATQSWVQSQGYLTSHQNLSSYATKNWVSANYVNDKEIWTGTLDQWYQLTSDQRSSYKIALIVE